MSATDRTRRTRRVLVAAAVLGAGLALAPVVFQMFSRAPGGGDMLDDFRPHMTQERIDSFRRHLGRIDAADAEVGAALAEVEGGSELVSIEALRRQWPGIQADMAGMLDDIEANLVRYSQVDALPPFALFPWFFVLPGLIAAGLAAWGLVRAREVARPRGAVVALAVLGVGLVAAPAMFRMWSRAPAGAAMIDDLRPLMTEDRVTTLQRSFLVIGAAEGDMRLRVLPAVDRPLPDTEAFVDRWPAMSAEMAPMIGAMADNLENFEGVDALPPFTLFPWFFVLPGLILVGLSLAGGLVPRLAGVAPAVPVQEGVT